MSHTFHILNSTTRRQFLAAILGAVLFLAITPSRALILRGGAPTGMSSIWFGATLPTLPESTPVIPAVSLPAPSATNHGAYFYPTSAATLASAFAAASQAGNGDVIVLPHASPITITSTLTLEDNSATGTGWIYVIPDTLDPTSGQYDPSSLPATGTRISPSNVSAMATIDCTNPGSGVCIGSVNNAHHYRFIAVNLVATGNTAAVYYGIELSDSATSYATLDYDIILDRSIIEGDASYGMVHGFNMDGENISAVDSYIYGCWSYPGSDAQAIWIGNAGGPYLINDDYLDGAVEDVLFGGDTISITNGLASDVTITNSYFYRSDSEGGSSDSKNLLEFKDGQRILVNYNHFENMYETGNQRGQAINISNIDQNGDNAWNVVQNVTITDNNFNNCAAGILVNGQAASGYPIGFGYLIRNNRFYIADPSGLDDGSNLTFLFEDGAKSIVFDHNTIVVASGYSVQNWLWVNNALGANTVFSDNIVDGTGSFGMGGPSQAGWSGVSGAYMTDPAAVANAFYNETGYPSGNYYPASQAAIDFTDVATGDFSLASASPYKGIGVTGANLPYTSSGTADGTDLGANMSQVAP